VLLGASSAQLDIGRVVVDGGVGQAVLAWLSSMLQGQPRTRRPRPGLSAGRVSAAWRAGHGASVREASNNSTKREPNHHGASKE
jgi:hypothetical protein